MPLVPTTDLRFVKRGEPCQWDESGNPTVEKMVRVLQQRWVPALAHTGMKSEWRDVPETQGDNDND